MAKGIKIKLDRKRHLLLTTAAMARFEEITGKQLLAQSTLSNLSLRDVIVMAWACLLHEDSKLTIDQVADAISPQRNMTELIYAIQKAWDAYSKEME